MIALLPSSYTPSSLKGKLLCCTLLWLPMWPFVDVSCPLTPFFPSVLQRMLVDFHVQPVPEAQKTLSADLDHFAPVTILHGNYSEQDVLEVIRVHPYSTVLIKKFADKDVTAELLKKFQDISGSNEYTLINDSHAEHQRLGGLFASGLYADGNPWDDFNSGRRRLVNGDLHGIWNGSAKNTYGAFVPVGQGSMHDLINWTSRKFTPDTSFFGWFSKKFVSTPLHANWPADTISLQLAGRKQWVIVDPFDMKATLLEQHSALHAAGTGGVYYPNLKVSNSLQAKLRIANQEAGDLLYFPPYAAHAVVSEAGLNVMTALRLPNGKKAFKIHPWKTLQAACVFFVKRVYQRLVTKKEHFSVKARTVADTEDRNLISVGVQLKSWSPTYDDLHLKALLEQ